MHFELLIGRRRWSWCR